MREKLALVIIILVGILPLFFIWTMDYLPFIDYPNHLARANIIKSYESSELYKKYFTVNFFSDSLPIPNIIFDLFVTKLLPFMNVDTAGKIFLSLYGLLSLSSILFLCREMEADGKMVLLGYLPIIYGLFFNMALLNFIFSIPLFIFALTVLLKFKKSDKISYLVIFVVLLMLVYLSHLFSFIILSFILILFFLLHHTKKKAVIFFFYSFLSDRDTYLSYER